VEVACKLDCAQDKLKRHYNAGYNTVTRWIHEAGISSGRAQWGKPAPDDLVAVLERMTVTQATRHYGVAGRVLARWRIQAGITGSIKRLNAPDDFAEVAPTMSQTELAAHYGIVNQRVIKRWSAETGAYPKAREYHPPKPTTAKSFGRRTVKPAGSAYLYMYDQHHKTKTIYDDAADTLRRYGPVYHCTDTGLMDPKGAFWRVGNVVCTPDELLARAARYERKAA
jgi:transposase-like protein